MSTLNGKAALEAEYLTFVAGATQQERTARCEQARKLTARVSSLLRAGGHDAPDDLLVCPYDLRSFDAYAVEVPSGRLILVHDTLFGCAYDLARAIAACLPAESKGSLLAEVIDWRAAVRIARALLGSISASGDLSLQLPLPEPRASHASFIAQTCVDFALAHEAAHVVLGHLEAASISASTQTDATVELSLPSWEQELVADLAAMRMLIAYHERRFTRERLYQGPTLLFEVIEALSALQRPRSLAAQFSIDELAPLRTHPRAWMRRYAVIGGTHPDDVLVGPRLPEVSAIATLMGEARGKPVMQLTQQQLERFGQLRATMDHDEVTSVFAHFEGRDGMLVVDQAALIEWVSSDHDRARAAIAMAVDSAAFVGPATSGYFLAHVQIIYAVYHTFFVRTGIGGPPAVEFDALLHEALPSFVELVIEHEQLAIMQPDGASQAILTVDEVGNLLPAVVEAVAEAAQAARRPVE